MSHGQPDELLAPVLAAFTEAWPGEDVGPVCHAYRIASRCLEGQLRYSGDPRITHAVEVAKIVAERGAARPVVCAALLHEAGFPFDRVRAELGDRVADLLDGLSRLEKGGDPDAAEPDVLLIKVVDRLHNMRTIEYVTPGTQLRKSEDTLQVLAPLATKLGAVEIARELAELATRTLRQVPRTAATRTLGLAAILLPRVQRARWLAEWSGELAVLSTRRARAGFVAQLILGMPSLARTLRHQESTHNAGPRRRLKRTVAQVIAVGLSFATITTANVTWAAAAVALAALALVTALLFARTDEPARRLRDLIDAWRGPRL